MAKRALLVGCNYPGTKCELHGCANDVRRMRTTLVERFGFDESDILVMLDTDPSTPQPTGANIRSSLNKLINSVQPGDALVFHYSGHGTQLPPEKGAPGETDTEEAIVPTDMNLLTDDDFRGLVNQIPDGVTFTFLSDSCHSGGLIDSEKEQIGGGTGAGGAGAPGRRYQRGEEEYGGYGRTEPVSGYSQSQGGYAPPPPPHTVSKNIPIDLLMQILSERTGQNVQVGNIRTTIFDMFGEQASPSVKMFVNLALSQLQQGGDQGGWLGTVSSLASQFLQTKLDSQSSEDAANYTAPAEQAGLPGPKNRVDSDVSVLISGCQSDQTSADASPTHNPANSYGAFSNAVQTVLSRNPSPMTNRELVLAVQDVLQQEGFKQRPCLYCSDGKVDSAFICV
ncbi:unnamed protein product [Sphagnum troendelagicum]|uniref:Peptidase C14 caspase domain-containing protein n=1 Tax=Sphagnum troendelagicum TaxID=128251 RepID=A0ABP0U4I3_9BRYO